MKRARFDGLELLFNQNLARRNELDVSVRTEIYWEGICAQSDEGRREIVAIDNVKCVGAKFETNLEAEAQDSGVGDCSGFDCPIFAKSVGRSQCCCHRQSDLCRNVASRVGHGYVMTTSRSHYSAADCYSRCQELVDFCPSIGFTAIDIVPSDF